MRRMNLWIGIPALALLLCGVACNGVPAPLVPTPTTVSIPTNTAAPVPSNSPPAVPTSAPPTITPAPPQPSQTATVTVKPTALVSTPVSTTTAGAPRIISFTVVPTTTHTLGEKMSMTWEAKGTHAAICPFIVGVGGPIEQTQDCSEVSLAGTKIITLGENSVKWNGILLRVTTGQATERSVVFVSVGCQGFRDWFFANPPQGCPQATAENSPAAAQHFEHGLMVWVKQPDRFYVFYDSGQNAPEFDWVSAPYSFKPGASPNNRVGTAPPRSLFEPVSGFGQLWRGEVEGVQNARQRLGWATGLEFNFDTSYQCAISFPLLRLWTCFIRGPDGRVLLLKPDSSIQVHLNWQVW